MRAAQLTVDTKTQAVETLYKNLPVGQEVQGVNYKAFGKEAGITDSQAMRLVSMLEDQGSLKRRYTIGIGGKVAYWTLLDDKETAISKIKSVPRSNASLRNRILSAIEEHGPFETVHDIILYVSKPGEQIDAHNVTHLLKGMRQQGILSFKQSTSGRRGRTKGGSGNNIPFGIQYNPNFMRASGKPTVVLPEPEPTPEPEPEPTPIMQTPEFPLIERLVMRREFLERAALLAEQGGEDALSLSLLEKAESKLSPIEQEMVNLWNAYQTCKG